MANLHYYQLSLEATKEKLESYLQLKLLVDLVDVKTLNFSRESLQSFRYSKV